MINYYLLTKPGIVIGNLFTVCTGFLLASKGNIDFLLLIATLFGLTCMMASACVLNNYIDRRIDRKMERTKNRALVTGIVLGRHALVFASLLCLCGSATLIIWTNLLTVFVAWIGFIVYVVLYSLWKCRTIYGTAIGSIAGAVPPVVGYCAVSHRIDMAAVLLFAMMVLWQMPHFFSIALLHLRDYTTANIPVLPVVKGIWRTKMHMVAYIAAFVLVAMMFTLLGYTGYLYLTVTTLLGCSWLLACLRGFQSDHDQVWGRQMFRLSLLMINSICVIIPLDLIL